MRKLRNMIGMPVVMNGRKIGRLMHAELTDDFRALRCIWMDAGLKGTRRIPSENLEMIGQMAVMTDSRGTRMRCRGGFPVYRAVSTDGRRIGAITGAEIDEISFLVVALELSGGLWDDLMLGRRRIIHYRVDAQDGKVTVLDEANEDSQEEST